MAFPEKFIDELVSRNDIVSVVSEYVRLSKHSGSNIFGLCPFHNEKTPSFSVSPSRQTYHCFGCGKGGGVINFIMEVENLPYPDAVEKLAGRVGLTMPEEAYDPDRQKRSRLYALNKAAARFFYDSLYGPSGSAAREYMKKRQISKRTATNFGLGFAPDGWDNMKNALLNQGYSKEELIDAGLAKPGKDGSCYDAFRNRLMFPVIDIRGNVIAFSGRILGDGEPKYLNSPQTMIFDKGRNLFALNFAKNTKSGYFLLTEGNVDVVSLHQAGFDCAVASLGTSLTPQQAQLISRYTDQVVLAYDSDTAGVKAVTRAMEIFDRLDVRVKVLHMTGAKDPDEFIKLKGADAFQALIDGSENTMDYKLSQLEKQYNLSLPDHKLLYISDAEALAAALPTEAERQVYSAVIAEKLSVNPSAVAADVEKQRKKILKGKQLREQRDAVRVGSGSHRKYADPQAAVAEEGIISLLLFEPSLVESPELPAPEEFSDGLLASIFRVITARIKNHQSLEFSQLSSELDNEAVSLLVEISQLPVNMASVKVTLQDYISFIHRKKHSRWADISSMLAQKQNQ